MNIKNARALINSSKSSLDRKARRLALSGINAALNAVDPKEIIKSKVVLKKNLLKICGCSFDLSKFRNVFVVGGGKAGGSMAQALEEVLKDLITDGMVNIPYASGQYDIQRIKLREARHPVPDEAGERGVRRMLDLVSSADEKDLVICLISGGGSSLMPLPRGGISIQDKTITTDALLKSGATINEINAVRKHISDFKGGWLARRAYPATVINLVLSDVIGDPLDSIASGPTVPDTTTFREAIHVLKRYRLWSRVPDSVRKVLLDGQKGLIPETPKANDKAFRRVHNFVVANNQSATLTAYNKLHDAGLNTLYLTSYLEGEARYVGTMFAAVIKEIIESGNPIPKPAGIVAGGETTVTVVGGGQGGRNQEIALGTALKMKHTDGTVIASIDTDGIDGPTDAAGALADGKTIHRSKMLGLNAENFLVNNDSYTFFSKLGNLIFTGPTGTNVNDISVIIVI